RNGITVIPFEKEGACTTSGSGSGRTKLIATHILSNNTDLNCIRLGNGNTSLLNTTTVVNHRHRIGAGCQAGGSRPIGAVAPGVEEIACASTGRSSSTAISAAEAGGIHLVNLNNDFIKHREVDGV